ncbi:beta strand repeat-containing protein [Flavivirga spongiicola]|uniref:Right-handed parallel beta-helix repeat-containing protein n=1 Tax=Flavivirga spongiicola TaxID=421621 RepID=A0ABU7XQS3_9FLAO|nr:right-handed parallel beta-helix repeat-containing protein [Flavivirga sp. MEBiC05379]MDO5978125.1 right-handed parallel beta-helix repeat-containing protein [Flavivirga sp. MEBiC05379]
MIQKQAYSWITMALFFMATVTIQAQDYIVTDYADTNTPGTLRWSINQANGAAGPHTITFDGTGGTIDLTANLPLISTADITIDGTSAGGEASVIIDAGAGDNGRYIFRVQAGGTNATLRGMTLLDSGNNAIILNGSPTGVVIEDIIVTNSVTTCDCIDSAVYVPNNAIDLTIRNVVMTEGQTGQYGIIIAGTSNNVTIDKFILSKSDPSMGIRFSGAANNVNILNTTLDLQRDGSGSSGDYGIYFISAATNITIDELEVNNADGVGLYFTSTADIIRIDDSRFSNATGETNAIEIRFAGVATDVIMNTVTLDLDHTLTTNDGDYGIYFNTTANQITLNGITMHDPEVHGIFIGGVATDITLTNSTFDNFDGSGTNEMIRFNNVVNGITMTDVTIDADFSGTTDDGNTALYFLSDINQDDSKNATFTNLDIRNADSFQFHAARAVNNFTVEGSTFTGNTEANAAGMGIDLGYNYIKRDILINNNTFLNLQQNGILIDTDGTNATSNIKITNNTISGTTANGAFPGNGIIVWEHNGVTDFEISGNTIFDNAAAGIAISHTDGINISQNSIYNNALIGIDNQNNNGGNDLEQIDGDTPLILNSVNTGVDTYDVTFTTPPTTVCNPCDIEFFTNQASDSPYNGRTYVHTETGLSGATTYTRSINSGGENIGFWTTTLKSINLNSSVSEFGDAYKINPTLGPGGVTAGLNLWLRADVGTTPTSTGTLTGWENLAQFNVAGQFGARPLPSLIDGSATLFNFNKAVQFTATNQKIGNVTSATLGTSSYDIFTLTKEGMTGSRFFNIGRDNITLNGTNWDSPGLYTSGAIAIRNRGGGLPYLSNPGGTFSATIPSITYNRFTDVSVTKGFNGANTGGIGAHGSTGSPMGGYVLGDTRSTGTGGDDSGFIGTVGEFIAYNRNLSATERRQVDSYMAIKYGLTLDLTVASNNYLLSDASVIWNATANSAYNNDIAGIGRDDKSALSQKQSKSVNADAIVTIGLGGIAATNIANANTFTTDKDFLIWGNDNASIDFQTTELPAGALALQRIGREWKVQENGSVSNQTIAFSNINVSSIAYDYELYVDTDGDGNFANATIITGGVESGGTITFAGVDLNHNDVFTLGVTIPIPGGISNGLSAWYRSSENITTTSWPDDGPVGSFDLTKVGSPTLMPTAINFNPGVDFPGSRGNRYERVIAPLSGGSNATVFYVGTANRLASGDEIKVGFGTSYDNPTIGSFNRKIGHYDGNYGTGTNGDDVVEQDEPYMHTTSWLNATAPEYSFNGLNAVASNGMRISVPAGSRLHFGADIGGGDDSGKGIITEVVIYNTKLTPVEREQVESYLALKFGITLDQTTARNYVASDASVVWNATTNSLYNNDIAGIGKDDLTALNQKQSKSINEDAMVTIGLGGIAATNIANVNTFTTNKDYLIWGNDNASIDLQTTELPASAGALQRIGREWKVQENGSVNNQTIAFSNIGISPLAYNFELFVDTDGDGDFTNATVIGGVESGGVITFSGVDLNNNDLFTLGFTQPSPGGVTNSLSAWFEANQGATTALWEDQSGNNRDAAGRSLAGGPTGTMINFNPSMSFVGASINEAYDISGLGLGLFTNGNFSNAAFSVGSGTGGAWLSSGAVGTDRSMFLRNSPTSTSFDLYNRGFSPGGASTETRMMSVAYASGTSTRSISLNSMAPSTNSSATLNFLPGQAIIGHDLSSGTNRYNGDLPEVIFHKDVDLTAIETLRIESYLAIKYGLTLDQSSLTNYLASDASVIWDATTNSLYNYDIAGIGRDDLSGLTQKQSKSVNTDAIVTIGLGGIAATNIANANTFTTNKDFLVWGNDNASTAVVNSGIPSAFSEKTARNWLVNETGAVGSTLIQIPNSAVAGFSSTTELMLFVADDSGFTTNVVTVPLVQNGANWEVIYDFDGTKYFTFGIVAPSDFMRHGKNFQNGVEQKMKF